MKNLLRILTAVIIFVSATLWAFWAMLFLLLVYHGEGTMPDFNRESTLYVGGSTFAVVLLAALFFLAGLLEKVFRSRPGERKYWAEKLWDVADQEYDDNRVSTHVRER